MTGILHGKVAFVTGAAGGIGSAIAREYARSGAHVIATDLVLDQVEMVAEHIRSDGGSVLAMTCDVSRPESVEAAIESATEVNGAIDLLVNNAGIWSRHLGRSDLFSDSDPSVAERIFDVNVYGTLRCTRAALKGMIRRGSGKVINLGSVAAVNGLARMVEYSASKGAIVAFTRALAIEVAEHGITVNCISPGSIDTGGSSPATLLGRIGQPEDVAALALYLASPGSDFITGQNLIVDGGRTLSTHWPARASD